MRIGELAERAGVSPRALRHYEELGLLPARRRSNGYREYGDDDLRVLAEIRSLVGFGFSLEETRPFVECLRAGNEHGVSCAASASAQRRKIAEIDALVARLREVRVVLAHGLDPMPSCTVDTEPVGATAIAREPTDRMGSHE